ncbi:MAG: DUF2184 domain-containing protein [Holosporaceae bacterium]|jgi:hypothetical protein|nr:DUF2184 domain-containing protein [Holosporaceae bacterium]
MDTDNIVSSVGAICIALDGELNTILMAEQMAPREWGSVFPAGSYSSSFNREQSHLTIPMTRNIGYTQRMSKKESTSAPSVEITIDTETINLYDIEQIIKCSHKEIASFQYWINNARIIGSDLLTLKAGAALEITEQLRNKFFFMGDGNAVKGLFNNKDMVDITAKLPTTGDIVNWVSVALAYVRQVSYGIVKSSTILVSPMAFAYLNNYKDSSDKSYYTKVSEIVTDTPGGNPQTLKIIVLDILSTTVSPDNPFGDIYFLTNNPRDYRYFYKSMLAGQFVPSGARSIEAATDAKYSDPYVLTKYALTKATPHLPTNMEELSKIKQMKTTIDPVKTAQPLQTSTPAKVQTSESKPKA